MLSVTYKVITYDYWMNQLATATTSITWYLNQQQQSGGNNNNNNNVSGNQQSTQSVTGSTTLALALPIYATVLLSVGGLAIALGVLGGLVLGALKLVWSLKTSGAAGAAVSTSAVPLTSSAWLRISDLKAIRTHRDTAQENYGQWNNYRLDTLMQK